MDFGEAIGYGTDQPVFWISTGPVAEGPNREVHIAFTAPDVEAVRAWHAKAVEFGAETLHEPRMWPEYHPGYFWRLRPRPRWQQCRGRLPHRRPGRLTRSLLTAGWAKRPLGSPA